MDCRRWARGIGSLAAVHDLNITGRQIMHPAQSKIVVVGLVTALALVFHVSLEGVDVRVENDKAFDFKPVRTWAWNPQGAGDVMMARTPDDDPAAMKRLAEPWILDAVATEMMRRGLQQATSQPDLTVTCTPAAATNTTRTTMGQFLPATTGWGPPFAPATTSLKMMNQGSLVLDLSAKGEWSGAASPRRESLRGYDKSARPSP